MKSGAIELMKEDNLILYHDKASVHRAGVVGNLLKSEGRRASFHPATLEISCRLRMRLAESRQSLRDGQQEL